MSKSIRTGLVLLLSLFVSSTYAFTPTGALETGFQPNLGQMDERVAFWAQRDGIELFVSSKGELIHRLHGTGDQDWVLVERMAHANSLVPVAARQQSAKITMMGSEGSRSAFTSDLIDLGEVWNGIRADLQVSGDSFEKRFHLDAGADVAAIGVNLEGIEDMRIASDGRLILLTGLGEVELSAPVAWQEINGQRQAIEVAYALIDERNYGFALGKYDSGHSLTIDPIIRSTFVGSGGAEGINHLEIADDSVYVTGISSAPTFPGAEGGYQPNRIANPSYQSNIYIARYSLDLTTLLHATYFGSYDMVPDSGGIFDRADVHTLVVTADGVYINGRAPGRGTHIPTTAGSLQPTPGGGSVTNSSDAYVSKLSRDLSQLLASTYYGGSSEDVSSPMVVSDSGVFIAGYSGSTNLAGLVNGANNTPPSPAGTGAAYVAKLSLDLSSAIAASWISGGGWDMTPQAMTLGADGSVYVAGYGRLSLFNTSGAAQPARAGLNFNSDGFIVRLNSNLSIIHRSTFLGSTGNDRVYSLVFANGKLYAAGNAGAANFPVPVGGAVTTWTSGASYIAAIAADLSTIDGASFYGGSPYTTVAEVLANDSDVFLVGATTSTSLPATTGAAEPSNPGGLCGFAASLNFALTQVNQSTYIACGGAQSGVYGADFGDDDLYFAGTTERIDLPGSSTGAQPNRASSQDAFIMLATADLAGPKPNADISVIKTGSDKRIANKYVLYTVSVSNIGPDAASEVLIEDTLPVEISAATWRCSGFDGASCPQASGSGSISETAAIPLGGRLEYEICGLTGFSHTVTNTATASVPSHTLDPNDSNNSDTVSMQDPRIFADSFEDTDLAIWCPSF